MVAPTTVWMVYLDGRSTDEIEGTLSEDDDGLVFTELSGVTTRFPFSQIAKVKRVMASPIFMIRHGPEQHETAFYLTRPPPLGVLGGQEPSATATALQGRFRGSGKWRQRRDNTRYLAATSTGVKSVRDEWVARIQTGMRTAGGAERPG
jgi:hypothetical protein